MGRKKSIFLIHLDIAKSMHFKAVDFNTVTIPSETIDPHCCIEIHQKFRFSKLMPSSTLYFESFITRPRLYVRSFPSIDHFGCWRGLSSDGQREKEWERSDDVNKAKATRSPASGKSNVVCLIAELRVTLLSSFSLISPLFVWVFFLSPPLSVSLIAASCMPPPLFTATEGKAMEHFVCWRWKELIQCK